MIKILLLLTLLTACSTPSVKPIAPVLTGEEAEANLTRDEAIARSAIITDIAYSLDLHVNAESESFRAVATTEFKLLRVDSVFLDFKNGAKIDSVVINDKAAAVTFQNHRLILPAASLHQGVNKVVVTYVQTYSHDGRGLHRFVDPEDKAVYIYTQFEAYDAHQMFPCFDQPDMKATMTMKVSAPSAWQIITTTRESSVKRSADESVWSFPITPKISTYLFALHAGPYAKWEEKAGAIPMRLFVRQALKKYVKPAEWFVPTRQGLAFYGKYFAYPYPFKKFDEIIAPDFNAGAMENVAAITFSERYVHRGASTREEREGTASVILHEMAHMWFGDLVTMKWWNGLWLNESFATFMSALSQANATEFKESWESFYRHEKVWAYWEDQLVTTHPIEARIDDVATAFTNFDGITYGKGASVLKQLNYFLGEDKFRDGVRYYFNQHAYSNTSLKDFVGALEHSSGRSLSEWSSAWLEDQGLDTVEAVYTCDSGHIAKFQLKAIGPDAKKTPRTHKTLVAIYDANFVRSKQVGVEYGDGMTDVAAFVGSPCPAFVDPNDEDHDYVKVRFDARSLETVRKTPMALKDSFVRLRAWPTLENMVRDTVLKPDVYLEVAAQAEAEDAHVPSLEILTRPLPLMFHYLTDQGAARTAWITRFEKISWDRALRAAPGSDLQKVMLMKFVEIAESQDALDKINDVLTGAIPLKGLDLDADRRWTMIVRMSALGDKRAADLLASERTKDASENGIQMAMAVEAAAPTSAAKRAWFDKLTKDDDLKYARARTATQHMFPTTQEKVQKDFVTEFYTRLPEIAPRRNIDMVELFADRFTPMFCTAENSLQMQTFLDKHPDLPPTLKRLFKINHQEDVLCAKARAMK